MAGSSTPKPKKRRGPGRPFQKGQSGNPSGRQHIPAEVIELARSYAPEAIDRLAYWMRADDPRASPSASIALLNRGYGMPSQDMGFLDKDGNRTNPPIPAVSIVIDRKSDA